MDMAATAFLELASRGKNAWWRYVAVVILACLIAGALTFAGSLALASAHLIDTHTIAALQHPTNAPVFFLGVGATFGVLLIGFAIAIALLQRKRMADITGPWRWRLFLTGFVIWLAVEVVGTFLDFLLAPHGFSLTVSHATLALALFAAAGLAVQTFTEEFIFRGFLTQGIFLLLKRPVLASVVSGVLFGTLHIPNGAPQAVSAGFFGIACSYIAIRTGGIALTYGIHLANNAFGAIVVISADDVFKGSPGIFTQNTPHLLWWDAAVSALAFAGVAALAARGWLARAAQNR